MFWRVGAAQVGGLSSPLQSIDEWGLYKDGLQSLREPVSPSASVQESTPDVWHQKGAQECRDAGNPPGKPLLQTVTLKGS